MSQTLRITLITLAAFTIHYFVDDIYFKSIRTFIDVLIDQRGVSHIIAYSIVGIPIFAAVFLIRKSGFFNNLGLNKSFLKALAFAGVCTLPIFAGFALVFDLNTKVTLNRILIAILAAAFFEELYFRAFLFGQVYKFTAIGFLPAVFFGALLFGMIHLYQSNDFNELVGIFLITFLGAILFAWTYVEWNYNVWVPGLLHLLMNLAWEMFDISDNALGGMYPNIIRTITIVLIIAITIFYKRRKGIPLAVNRHTILYKKKY